jgi:hypothetical protein
LRAEAEQVLQAPIAIGLREKFDRTWAMIVAKITQFTQVKSVRKNMFHLTPPNPFQTPQKGRRAD